MRTFLYFKTIGIYIIASVIIDQINSLPFVKMTVTVNTDSMTLSCLVNGRDNRKNIYLFCPLVSGGHHCRENCNKCQNEFCLVDSLIDCKDYGFDPESNVYRIDYVIDGSRSENHGKWLCQYGGESSPNVYVNTSSSKTVVPPQFNPATKFPLVPPNQPKSEIDNSNKVSEKQKNSGKKASTQNTDEFDGTFQYDKLLTKSEFIITVIGLLALSLFCNVLFCSRMILVHCRSKKKANDSSQYFSMNPNNPPYNHSNSQVSDPDRIYEDTSINQRQLSFLTQIKNNNGNYLAPNHLSPASGLSTMLPHLSFNQQVPFANSPSDSGSTHLSHPFLADQIQANYASVNFPTENSYTNFLSVQPNDISRREVSHVPQPVYLAFQSPPHPMMTAGNRYVQYSSQPLQSMATMSKDNRAASERPQETSSSSSIIVQPMNRSPATPTDDVSKSNYQLSREMMEEADTLLRTADTLLKSTEQKMNYCSQ